MKIISYILCVSLSTFAFSQQFPQLDQTFNGNGKFTQEFGYNDNIQETIIQNDQKIVAVGTSLSAAFAGNLTAIRVNENGLLDTDFASNGIFSVTTYTESYAYRCIQKPDGKLVIAGCFANEQYRFSMLVIQLNVDGTIDSSFGVNGKVELTLGQGDSFVYALGLQSDQKIVLGGTSMDLLSNAVPTVVRLNADGNLDTSFGLNGVFTLPVTELDNRINDLKIQVDGAIVFAGHIGKPITGDGQTDFDILVGRLTTDGVLDYSFSNDGITVVPIASGNMNYVEDAFAVELTNDGGILLGGYTTNDDFSFDGIIAKLATDGSLHSNFGTNGIFTFQNAVQDVIYGLELSPSNELYAAGTSGGFFFDDRDFLVLKVTENGVLDTSFNNDGFFLTGFFDTFEEANSIAMQQDGKIVLAGKASNGNNNDMAIARISFDGTNSVEEFSSSSSWAISPNPLGNSSLILENVYGKVSIFNAIGELIYSSIAEQQLEIQHVVFPSPGMYFIQVGDETKKVLVN